MNSSSNSNTTTEPAPPPAPRENRFDWPVCYEAEVLLLNRIDAFRARNRFANQLAEQMLAETGTLLLDWMDCLVVPPCDEHTFREAGFTEDPLSETANNGLALHHPDALLPRVLLAEADTTFPVALVIRTESLADFMVTHRLTGEADGEPYSRLRRLVL